MLRRLLFSFLFTVVAALHAQSVRWEPGSGTLALNQLSELSLVFDQCEPSGTVTPPTVNGLMFGSPIRSESTSFSVVNFKTSKISTITLTYRVRPTERTTLVIPAFTVETDKGKQRVASATFMVGNATIGQTGLSAEDVAQARFTLPASDTVWAGEVFPLTYTLGASKRYLYNLNKDFEWDAAPLSIEPWPNPEQIEAVLNNDPRVSVIYKTRALAKTAGSYALHPATHLVNITTGSTAFGVFARANLTQLAITTPRTDLTVRPLPTPAPAGFTGAVGKFTLDSKVVPLTASVGEPITWTLTLEGTGNWPDVAGLPARSVSKDFRIVQPQAKRVNKDNALFDASITEDIVLIPTKPGAYTLAPVTFSVFNPATGSYETLSTKAVTIQVAAAPGATHAQPPASTQSSATGTAPLNGESATPSVERAAAPASAIPRDPLPQGGTSIAPFSRPVLAIGLASSALVPLFIWLGLALNRARLTDPSRPAREAHTRLMETVRQLNAASDAQRLNLLQQWQRDVAIFWGLSQAVPTPASFSNETWSTLWSEAERTLYGAASLPADWTQRASEALVTRRAPVFSALQLLQPRNLLPLLLVVSFLAINQSSFAATDGRAVYAKGEFAAAETVWNEALKTTPTDWSSHHNLALALVQQNRPGEAAGHALAAFVQQPQNPSVQWHLGYTFKAAGVTPTALKPFLNTSPTASLARLASPARWQTILIASAWMAALALSLGIYGAYQKRPRKWLVRSLIITSLLLAAAGGVSLQTYGALADSRAVVVVTPTTLRSIPTDLDTPQKTTALATGVIASTDKTFLGWRRLAFADGQTGWVRAETVVPLWK